MSPIQKAKDVMEVNIKAKFNEDIDAIEAKYVSVFYAKRKINFLME
jgi:hypothetical protein